MGRWLELATANDAPPASLSDLRDDVPWYRCIEHKGAFWVHGPPARTRGARGREGVNPF